MSITELSAGDCKAALTMLRRFEAENPRIRYARGDDPPVEYHTQAPLGWRGEELATLWGIPVVVDESVHAGVIELRSTVASLRLGSGAVTA